MVQYDPLQCLPSSAELPDSDDTPVDNELQNLIPNLLEAFLALTWSDRLDWFFGVDMGVYHTPSQPPLVPDGFLSIGVERFVGEEGRLSYVLWEEDGTVPLFALEVISKTHGGEYEQKKIDYAQLGIRYYAIYVPSRQYRRKREFIAWLMENTFFSPLIGFGCRKLAWQSDESKAPIKVARGNGCTGMTKQEESCRLPKNWHCKSSREQIERSSGSIVWQLG